MDNRLRNIIDPALDYIDSGSFFRQPFKWLYYVIGILNFAVPVFLINLLFEYSKYASGSTIFCMVMLILFSIVIAFLCCLLWFRRACSLNRDASKGSRFIAIPVIANLIQTAGESLGVWIGIGGFITTLFILIFGGDETRHIIGTNASFITLLACIIFGYLTVVIHRFFAELFLATVSIANNTKSIDSEVKSISSNR